jgi:hypothetical protein
MAHHEAAPPPFANPVAVKEAARVVVHPTGAAAIVAARLSLVPSARRFAEHRWGTGPANGQLRSCPMDGQDRIAYSAATPGVPVLTSDGVVIGTLDRVLDIPDLDLFDGIVVVTEDGDRFVDRDQVSHFTTVAVHCEVTAAEAASLPAPENPPTYRADPRQDRGSSIVDRLKRAFGKAKWTREKDDT